VEKRAKNIFNKIKKNLDAIVIKNANYPFIDDNFFYITGLEKGIFEGSLLIVQPDGTLDILVSELEEESASKSKANIHVYRNKKDMENIIKTSFSSIKNIGVNCTNISYRDFCKLKEMFSKSKFTNVSGELLKARLVKDETEIEIIKKACKISDKVMKKILDMLYEGIYEFEIAAEINYLMQKLGADKPAFVTISSFNKNTAEPHYSHGNTRLKKGDFALFDFGASIRKYNSDITRTIVYGKADKKQKEMHETVLAAQQKGFDSIKSGNSTREVHAKVKSYIDNTKFKGRFIHSTGHSIGLAVHDGAIFGPESNVELQENMVFTVEPGVYIPGFGGVRIEDDILVKKESVELLTNSPRILLEI
jgi:Xaa-Pro dipeptidase